LTSVIGYTQLVQQSESLDEQARDRLGIVTREAERTRRIVSNLLSFARQHKPVRVEVDINEMLERTLELRAYEMRVSNIQVETHLKRIPKVRGDDHQLQQVFMNIIINAEQAIRDSKTEGKLRITSEVKQTDQPSVVVKIADDGPGILPQHVEKVFDPFFSTKPVGKGSGLGLSITYGIVKEHGGGITVANNRYGGATFTVELPVRSDHN
jgi:two-component system NtrC family sensor kinase